MESVQQSIKHTQNMLISKVLLSFLILNISLCSEGQNKSDETISKLKSEIKLETVDSLKIKKISNLAYYYYDFLDNKQLADSLSLLAINLAEASYNPVLQIQAYNWYIKNSDGGLNQINVLVYAQKALKLSRQTNNPYLEWISSINLAKVHLARYEFDKALGISYQALSLADGLSSEDQKAESYLMIGQILEGNNLKVESFRNYLNATSLAEKTNNKILIKKCYSRLSGFYNSTHIFEKALSYKLKQLNLITSEKQVDSLEYFWAQFDLQVINLNSNNNIFDLQKANQILEWAIRNNSLRLKRYEISLYRTHLIEAENINLLRILYTQQYPAELKNLYNDNPATYFRLKAYFCEEEDKIDSAYYYISLAENLIQSDPNTILKSNFYQRYGQFLIRQGKISDAIAKYSDAYNLAKAASYFEYMLKSAKNLELLYKGMGDYKNAYTYSALNKALTDSINLLSKNDQLLMLEIDHESRQRDHLAEQEQIQTHRRHNIQYTAITIIILALFIILMALGSLKVPAWIIKMLGFFSFILFFEFIIMIADHKIYEITHNEPWKILLIKIGLIAFLLPFHHWIEKKVIHYLIEHKLIKIPRFSFRQILKKKKPLQKDETLKSE